MRSYSQWRELLQGHSLPLAWVDLDALDANLTQMLSLAAPKPLRIATKSIRARGILSYLLARSPRLHGLMTYSAAETVWLAHHGFDNLLLAYPSADRPALQALVAQVAQGKQIWVMVDSLIQAQMLDQLAREAGTVLPICLDIDMSTPYPGLHFGVWRSPLHQPAQVMDLVRSLLALKSLHLSACMGYEAQIAGVGDAHPGQRAKNWLIRQLKRHSIPRLQARRAQVLQALQQLGVELQFFNGGGTGSLESTAQDPSVTELTAGSGFYAPALFDRYQDFRLQPAAGFALPIVRQPAEGIWTCFSGGYIASGSVGPEKQPVPFSPPGFTLIPLEGAGEVQTPVRYHGPETLHWGDPLLFRHAKAGELCERFNELLLIRGQDIVERIPTYRGEGQCFG